MPPPVIPASQPTFATNVAANRVAPDATHQTDGFDQTRKISKYTLNWLFNNIYLWILAIAYFLFTDPGREHGFHASAMRTHTTGTPPSFNGSIWIFSAAGSVYMSLDFLRPGDVITNAKWVYDSGGADVTVGIQKRPYLGGGESSDFSTTDVTHGALGAHDTTPNVTIQAGYSYRMSMSLSAGSAVSAHIWVTHPTLV